MPPHPMTPTRSLLIIDTTCHTQSPRRAYRLIHAVRVANAAGQIVAAVQKYATGPADADCSI